MNYEWYTRKKGKSLVGKRNAFGSCDVIFEIFPFFTIMEYIKRNLEITQKIAFHDKES